MILTAATTRRRLPLLATICLVPLLTGCPASNPKGLDPATASFAQKNYPDVIKQTEDLIRSNTLKGEQLAATLYLQGRAYEELTAQDEAEKLKNLAAARRAYVAALEQRPSKGLEGRIRTGIANVAYFQEDFNTAVQQFNAAYELTDLPDQRPWILYRIGLSQQRLGKFDLADRTFVQVQQEYAGTMPASRARAHQGFKEFNVQVGVFRDRGLAQKLHDEVRRTGVPARLVDSDEGRHVMIGPASTFAAAKQLRERVVTRYPEAVIVP